MSVGSTSSSSGSSSSSRGSSSSSSRGSSESSSSGSGSKISQEKSQAKDKSPAKDKVQAKDKALVKEKALALSRQVAARRADVVREKLTRSGFDTASVAGPRKQFVNNGGTQRNPGLDAINALNLKGGDPHTCVKTTRANLQRAGLKGLPAGTGDDGNNPRGMMVQMLQSGHWKSVNIPESTVQTINSPYGNVQAHVLSGEAYLAAAANGQIPEGSVVFQTKKGWDYGVESKGSDVGIVRNGAIFNYRANRGMSVYGNNVSEVVVMHPQ
ncbi:hypothetical protein ACN28S_08710 [Cystobacter fuscus]